MSSEAKIFSERFRAALRKTHCKPDSPTQVTREFNKRYPGRPVTIHAVRKWIVGESIPNQEKLRTLALWLDVSAEWLRFGTEGAHGAPGMAGGHEGAPGVAQPGSPCPRTAAILEDLQKLDERYRGVVRELVRMLVEASANKR